LNTTKETKRSYYNKQIFNFKTKIKTTWNIVKLDTGKGSVYEDIHALNIDGNFINNQQFISDAFNDHFLSTTDRINNQATNNLNFGNT
jgi:hypothetical protein